MYPHTMTCRRGFCASLSACAYLYVHEGGLERVSLTVITPYGLLSACILMHKRTHGTTLRAAARMLTDLWAESCNPRKLSADENKPRLCVPFQNNSFAPRISLIQTQSDTVASDYKSELFVRGVAHVCT